MYCFRGLSVNNMSLFDGIILVIILYFAFSGYRSGFIRTVGGILGLLIGVFLAARYYGVLAATWQWLFFGSETLAKVALFILIFIISSRLVKLFMYVLDRFYTLLRFIPFTNFINKIAGGVLGTLEGCLIVGLILYIIVRYPFSQGLIGLISASELAHELLRFVNILAPLIPDTLEGAKIFM